MKTPVLLLTSLLFCCFGIAHAERQHANSIPTLLILGDSLSASYGMRKEDGWVHLLELRLQRNGYNYQILNSSISGDTTQGGLARLPRLLDKYQPEIVLLELGANDGLRGIKPDVMRSNMTAMIQLAEQTGATVILAGIKLPPNYGQLFTREFEVIYADLAQQLNTLLVPFFMQGIVFNPDLLQADGIHPNEKGQPLLLENVWPLLSPILKKPN